ncbi:MAG: SelB C-terminal domain-containing protein, partial [Actinomycetota bacterium]|nr:SelB C-terminal domain-containing protein [Actinomycetota bacterium]
VREGRVHAEGRRAELPAAVRLAVETVRAELAERPFAAPEANRLAELGLGTRQLAAAARAEELLKIADGVYLLPGADVEATERLAGLLAPFTLSQARQALSTTRRVAVPLMEYLARRGLSRKLPDGTHELR